jgi:tRNA-dihydrouridine synthase
MENILNSSFDLCKNWNKLPPFEFWNNIGNPKYVCAPMVDQSELAFRTLVRKYGCDLTFTPMIHSVMFATQEKCRQRWLEDISEYEQPCFVQFCGHDPEILLKSAKHVEKKTPCIDLNLGCPQGIARRGNYGSFLLENEELVLKIVGYLVNNLKCGVSCKIRLFTDLKRSYQLAKNLEENGIKVLTIHGRTREQNKDLTGLSNWQAIRKIKELINVPIIANGGIEEFEDIQKCFDSTNCDAVMSAEKLLENPFLFSGMMYDIDETALEFIEISRKLDSDISSCRAHLYKFYYQACQMEMSFNDKLMDAKTFDEFQEVGIEVKDFRKENNISIENKFGWYYRYRKEKSILESNNSPLIDMSTFFG